MIKNKKQVIRLRESDLHRIVKESVNRVLKESFNSYGLSKHYYYIGKCTQMEADEVQEITHWDEGAETNNYCIQDEYWEGGTFEIVPIENFLEAIEGEYHIKPNQIVYCALNLDMNILFCYSKRGIHYFYE